MGARTCSYFQQLFSTFSNNGVDDDDGDSDGDGDDDGDCDGDVDGTDTDSDSHEIWFANDPEQVIYFIWITKWQILQVLKKCPSPGF